MSYLNPNNIAYSNTTIQNNALATLRYAEGIA